MPLTAFEAPCWRLVTSDGTNYDAGSDGVPHFDTEADARQEAKERADGALGIQIPGLTPRSYPTPCVTVKCDGCGSEPESDDFSHLHYPSAEDASTKLDDFTIIAGQVWCGDCRRAPHVFVADPRGGPDCGRCAWPADEHETDDEPGSKEAGAYTVHTPAQENALIRMLRDIRDGHLRAYVANGYDPMLGQQVPNAELRILCDRTLAGSAPDKWWVTMLSRGWVAVHMTGGSAYLRCEQPGSDALAKADW